MASIVVFYSLYDSFAQHRCFHESGLSAGILLIVVPAVSCRPEPILFAMNVFPSISNLSESEEEAGSSILRLVDAVHEHANCFKSVNCLAS